MSGLHEDTAGKTRKIRQHLLVQYTFLFAAAALLCFSCYLYYQKTFIWKYDGVEQHYLSFGYLGRWVREILRHLLNEHKLIIPLWEWGIGFGDDVLLTQMYYTFGDPFALISVVTPSAYIEWGYGISILLRFYCAGLAFCAYANKMKCERWAVLCGSVLYTFSAFALFAGLRHPYFANPMIYLPLLLLGCEKVFRRESPLLLTLSAAVAAISNFYFFYMLVILVIIYVVLRQLTTQEWRKAKSIVRSTLRIGSFAGLGVAMAAITFLPIFCYMLSNQRVSEVYEFNPILYTREYQTLFATLVDSNGVKWGFIGMAAIAYTGVISAFIRRAKETLWARWFFAVQVIMLLLPVFGHIMNGFGYVAHRWVFAWGFVVSFLFVKEIPYLVRAERRYLVRVILIMITGYVLFLALRWGNHLSASRGMEMLLLSGLALLLLPECRERKLLGKLVTKEMLQRTVVLLLCVAMTGNLAFVLYSRNYREYAREFMDYQETANFYQNERVRAAKLIRDEGFYRIDSTTYDNELWNYPITDGLRTTTAYWSLMNENTTEFLMENSLQHTTNYNYQGMDERAFLQPLLSCKYYIISNVGPESRHIPYGFERIDQAVGDSGKQYDLYQTKNTLPFGFTFDSVMSESQWYQCSYAERQQRMLQTAVIPDKAVEKTGLPADERVTLDHFEVPYEISDCSGIEITGDRYVVTQNNAVMTLELKKENAGELYLDLEGVDFEPRHRYEFLTEDEWMQKTVLEQIEIKEKIRHDIPARETDITASTGGLSYTQTHYTNKNIYTLGTEDYLLNLGYSGESSEKLTVRFSETGVYSMDMRVVCQPMEHLTEYLDTLKQDEMTEVSLENNRITGRITVNEPKLLCFSLPYSSGWRVFVDGKEQELLRTNLMLSGVVLSPGEHRIELTYKTPYLKCGLVISAVSVIGFLGLCIGYIRRKRK